jgi:hypothetical protein
MWGAERMIPSYSRRGALIERRFSNSICKMHCSLPDILQVPVPNMPKVDVLDDINGSLQPRNHSYHGGGLLLLRISVRTCIGKMCSKFFLSVALIAIIASVSLAHTFDEKRAELDLNATSTIADCPGYVAYNIAKTETSLTADLRLAGAACNVYGNDILELKLLVEYQTGISD